MFFKVKELSLDLNGHLQIPELRIKLSGEKMLLSKIYWFIETDLRSHNSVTLLSVDDYCGKVYKIKRTWGLILLFRIICGPF